MFFKPLFTECFFEKSILILFKNNGMLLLRQLTCFLSTLVSLDSHASSKQATFSGTYAPLNWHAFPVLAKYVPRQACFPRRQDSLAVLPFLAKILP